MTILMAVQLQLEYRRQSWYKERWENKPVIFFYEGKPPLNTIYKQVSIGYAAKTTFLYQNYLNLYTPYISKYISGPLWSYGSWIYNNLCNQCLSPLMLWVRIPLMTGWTWYKIMW